MDLEVLKLSLDRFASQVGLYCKQIFTIPTVTELGLGDGDYTLMNFFLKVAMLMLKKDISSNSNYERWLWLVFVSIIRRMRNKGKNQMEEVLGNLTPEFFFSPKSYYLVGLLLQLFNLFDLSVCKKEKRK